MSVNRAAENNAREGETWNELLDWLREKGFSGSLHVEPRSRDGAGKGLFATQDLHPSVPLFEIPESALLNSRTLRKVYPSVKLEGFNKESRTPPQTATKPMLNGTQLISIHLCLHRPKGHGQSHDPHFGPYISSLPRDFSSHPLSWIVRKEQGVASSYELGLLRCLPPSAASELQAVAKRFWEDWNVALHCKDIYPDLGLRDNIVRLLFDFLWAWLIVNTRCLYLQIFSENLPLSNLTLSPIIDIANHTTSLSLPQIIWLKPTDRVVEPHKLAFNSPSQPVKMGDELFLRYGGHCNRMLLTEYGFVDHQAGPASGEIEASDLANQILVQKQASEQLRCLLKDEGFLCDWHLYASPAPPHPSWRLLVALRLINLDLPTNDSPEELESQLKAWRNMMLGVTDTVSDTNEAAVQKDVVQICEAIVARSGTGLRQLSNERYGSDDGDGGNEPAWFKWVHGDVERLWEEEKRVAGGVLAAIDSEE